MTNYERMLAGLIYDPGDETIMREQQPFQRALFDFNSKPLTPDERVEYMKKTFAECGENCYIEPPFYANWGGAHLHLGDSVYANYCLTAVDDGHIYVGSRTMFGPNVTIATANHPINPTLRSHALQYNKDVHIGENCWIGAGVVICPGVSIGDNTVIGAGAVVTKDIPANVVAVGNPCRVMREIGERDDKYFYRDEEIDIPIE